MITARTLKAAASLLLAASLALAAFLAPSASAADDCFGNPATEFGVAPGCFDGLSTDQLGQAYFQAGNHPFTYSTSINFNTRLKPEFSFGESHWPQEPIKDILVDVPAGVIGNPTVGARCTSEELATVLPEGQSSPKCPAESQFGTVSVTFAAPSGEGVVTWPPTPLYAVVPAQGSAARFGFNLLGVIISLDGGVSGDGGYHVTIDARNTSEALPMVGADLTFWGTPGDSAHEAERWCPLANQVGCSSTGVPKPFLTLPTACPADEAGLLTTLRTSSWADPTDYKTQSFISHDPPGLISDPAYFRTMAPESWGAEHGIEECQRIRVKGSLTAQPTAIDTETPSGLKVHLEVPNPGLENPEGIATSNLKTVRVTLPEGLTVNPSQAEGLGTCSPAQYASTELSFFPTPGKGCPDDSKIGSVEVKTPLLEETIPGDVYIAKPFDNPFGSLLALYVVLHEPERGILIKLAGEVETDPTTGQITTTFSDLPQLPFSSFDFKFREGARAPLATPQACGTYTTEAQITPWSDPSHTISSNSEFQIVHGIGGGPCPSGGLPPFKPGLIAGSINNRAGAFSPFNIRLFRTDAEQEITHFSIKLPPGISGKLAGVPFCPDAAIAAAKAKSGAEELASPSCPKASEVGHTLAGAGVGSVLTYAPGKIYLAGPYNGSALSIAAITAAKVGPFDLGTVVIRQALKVDPETAEVFIDATGSDPIPHIIDGVTVHLRDIRAYVDKPEFTLNPTSCDRTSTASTLLGSGLDFASEVDDQPVTVSTPYQAADCAALGFKPDLKLSLKGGTKRGGHPQLRAVLKMKGAEANIARGQVTLPRSEFLDQSHIGTVCTRVQFVKDECPAKSVYGFARAITPILDEPLEGPVYLRSSEHKLPDLVAALHSGKIEIDLAGRIDSVGGRIRSTFEAVPDAPVSKFVLTMQDGKKGLLENSTDLCAKAHRAVVEFDGQNGKASDSNPALKPDCAKAKKHKRAQARSAR